MTQFAWNIALGRFVDEYWLVDLTFEVIPGSSILKSNRHPDASTVRVGWLT
jgi:hypothetical protein